MDLWRRAAPISSAMEVKKSEVRSQIEEVTIGRWGGLVLLLQFDF
jgi:hypothetical protein